MEIRGDNVNVIFKKLVEGIHTGSIPTRANTSRYGDVLRIPEPIIVVYETPVRRVLFNPQRDCNHAFHLLEALWMLSGRSDVAPLSYYNSKMREFSDDGETFNAAYGYRWRHAKAGISYDYGEGTLLDELDGGEEVIGIKQVDQLDLIVDHLKAKPDSRRAVLQIWNV